MRGLPVVLLAWVLLSTLPVAESGAATSAPLLFDTPAGVREASSGVLPRATVRQRRASARLSLLTHPDGSPALGAGDRVRLNLFDDASFTMTVTDVSRHAGGLTWSGSLDGVDLGSAVLATYDGALAGHLSMPGAVYRIGDASDGTPVVEEVDQGALPPEGHPVVPAGADAVARAGETPQGVPDPANQIDVMVLYTAAARVAANGTAAMRAQVNLAIAAANLAYANNGLNQRLRLVYAGESSIAETNDFNKDLDRLRDDATVTWLRNATRADLVPLLVDNGAAAAFCGLSLCVLEPQLPPRARPQHGRTPRPVCVGRPNDALAV